jgi:hypothetical protein
MTTGDNTLQNNTGLKRGVGGTINSNDVGQQADHSHTWSGTVTITETSKGLGVPHENRPPYYALCFIIKTN